MIRSDAGLAHRLSLSARVVSAVDSQVKAKRQGWKRLWRLQNRPPPATRKARARQAAEGPATALSRFYPDIIGWRPSPCPGHQGRRVPRSPRAQSPRRRAENFALNPRHPRRCRHPAYRPAHAAYGSDRPTAFDRRRWRQAAFDASRARSPCRPISR